MSVQTDYYNNEAVLSFTSETAFTLPSYNSRAVLNLKNLSSPSILITPFGSETVDGASGFVLGGLSTAKLIKGETGWVVAEGSDASANNNTVVQSIVGNPTLSTTTAAGIAFTNQPANDGVEILSDSASDTQTATVIGTTTGTDTVVVEDVVLTGTTPASTVKTDWGVILAVKLSSAAVGTITFREASADAAITTITAGNTSKGVTTVTNTPAFNKVLSMAGSGATTKQLGFKGTNSAGTAIYDSQALTGTTIAVSNSVFQTVTEIYRGDLEATRTATVTQGLSGPDYAGTTTTDDAQAGKIGERLTGQLAAASTTSLSTGTAKNITSVQLTAGDWEVSGAVHFVPANTTTVTNLVAGISATTDTQPSTDSLGGYSQRGANYTAAGTVWNTVVVAPVRISLSATTTYYMVATATFGASTCTGHGFIRATRVR